MRNKFRSMLLGATVSQIVGIFMTVADSVIAGKLFGQDALAGVNLVLPLLCAALFLRMVVSIGIPILYGKAMGGFDKEEADRLFGTGLLMSILSGGLCFALSFAFGDDYLRFFHASEPVLAHAKDYLFWTCFDFAIMPLEAFIGAMVYADGDEGLSAFSDIFMIVANVPFSFALSLKFGTAGLSLGSLITSLLSSGILLPHFFKKANSLKPNLFFSAKLFIKIIRYSIVDAGTFLFLAVYSFVLEKYMAQSFGPEKLVVASAIVTILGLTIIFDGIGDAISPILNVYLGQGAAEGVENAFRLASRTSVLEGIVASGVVFASAPAVPWLLGITGAEEASLSVAAARIVSIGFVGISFLYLLSSYYLLLEKITLSVMICALRDAVAPIVLAVAMGELFGIYGVFAGIAIAPIVATLLTVFFIRRRYGAAAYPLLIPVEEDKKNHMLLDFVLSPEEIIRICDEIESALRSRSYADSTVMRTRLLTEELFMLIYEQNSGKTVTAECLVAMRDGQVELTEMDDGRILDLTDDDMPVGSLRAYLISNVSRKYTKRKTFLPTLSENRNTFVVSN